MKVVNAKFLCLPSGFLSSPCAEVARLRLRSMSPQSDARRLMDVSTMCTLVVEVALQIIMQCVNNLKKFNLNMTYRISKWMQLVQKRALMDGKACLWEHEVTSATCLGRSVIGQLTHILAKASSILDHVQDGSCLKGKSLDKICEYTGHLVLPNWR